MRLITGGSGDHKLGIPWDCKCMGRYAHKTRSQMITRIFIADILNHECPTNEMLEFLTESKVYIIQSNITIAFKTTLGDGITPALFSGNHLDNVLAIKNLYDRIVLGIDIKGND